MTEKESQLGELQAVYGMSPEYTQRAVIVGSLSFTFFIGTMIVFLLTQRFVAFLLSTAFLVVGLFIAFGWFAQSRRELKVYEKGFALKNKNYLWDELAAISVKRSGKNTSGEIITKNDEKILFTDAIFHVENFFKRVESEVAARK